MTASEPVDYPGLLHFRCGHGINVSGDAVGPGVWMVATDTDRAQLGVSMQPADAITIAAALADSALRATGADGSLKLVGGALEVALRRVLAEIVIAEKNARPGLGGGLAQARQQLRWMLGER